jgi:glycosyltransferase involved in cell wall biosynthesis
MKVNLSFIVIGKNEGEKLNICFKSIFQTIRVNNIQSYEVIYIDSNSTDNSMEIVSQFKEIRTYKINQVCNAAIARNIGAKESTGYNLFFIDGDMELIPDSFHHFFFNKKLVYSFISGNFINYYYNDGKFIKKEYYKNFKTDKDKYYYVTGGIFIIERKLWDSVCGMSNQFKYGEDLDFGLRLAKKKVLQLRRPYDIIIHHTMSYDDASCKWSTIKSWHAAYSRGLLYRRNLLNFYTFKRISKSDPSIIIFLIALISCIWDLKLLILYPFILSALIIFKYRGKSFISNLLFHVLRDFQTVLSFFFFFPSQRKNIKYKSCN